MRVRKADSNQAQLVSQMRKIPGVSVAHTHTIGQGFPDLCVSYRGKNYLFEVKDGSKPPSARKLTEDEQKFFDSWTGQVSVVCTIEDVLNILKAA